jgi:murein DD-endopeptidase MepM/ murein hydrolase activator NlpD
MFIRYTVKSGDTLSAIAQRFMGDAKRINEILDENLEEIKNKNYIKVNQVVVIPDDTHGSTNSDEEEPSDMERFHHMYGQLYFAAENASPLEVPAALEALLGFCTTAIDDVQAWLTARTSQIEPQVQLEFEIAGRAWQHFLADNDIATQALIYPISGRYSNVGGNFYALGMGLAQADLLRGRYAQLNRLITLYLASTEEGAPADGAKG